MNISYEEVRNAEIIHHADEDVLVISKGNRVSILGSQNEIKIKVPISFYLIPLLRLRLIRRLLRLDKMNVILIDKKIMKLLIIYRGIVYCSSNGCKPKEILKLEHGRNVLHNSIAILPSGHAIFGEYYGNDKQQPVNIYRINLQTLNWDIPFIFSEGEIRHVHSCLWDKFTEKIWIFTGDRDEESRVYASEPDFKSMELIGSGSQKWRAVSAFFKKDFVYWVMDSPDETSYLVRYERISKKIVTLRSFPGPAYYSINFHDNGYLIGTTHEPGKSVQGKSAHIYFSKDLENWTEIAKFQHDGLSMKYLKYGIIGFAFGKQFKNEFYFFCEAIQGMDGKSYKARIVQ